MGLAKNYPPCLQLIAAFSRYDFALDWLWGRVEQKLGSVARLSPRFDFQESEYYRASMGSGLIKQFGLLAPWYDPGDLAKHKLITNEWENEFAQSASHPEARPLNIDPGYMSMTKLVLASTKNREHRLYLRDGIYGEVTLAYRHQQWQPMPWTYPDYQRSDFRLFFQEARQHLATNVNVMLSQQNSAPLQS